MGVWEHLPHDLMDLILERLPITDYLRFPAVCPSWRDAQHHHRLRHEVSPRHLFQPWLFLADYKACQRRYYNLSEQRYYRISLPASIQRKYYGLYDLGASHGRLMFLDSNPDCPKKVHIILVNPFTGSEIVIRIVIPSAMLICLPSYKGILSSTLTDPDCLVLLQHPFKYEILLCHVREKTCIILKHPNVDHCLHGFPAICKGKFYFSSVIGERELVMVDPLLAPAASSIDMDIDNHNYLCRKFLLECDGEILLVMLIRENQVDLKVEVFRADLTVKVRSRLGSLHDRVLFLDIEGGSFSLSATQAGLLGNSIYFTKSLLENIDFGGIYFKTLTSEGEGKEWIEYDYGGHGVVGTKLSPLKLMSSVRESSRSSRFSWIVPTLSSS